MKKEDNKAAGRPLMYGEPTIKRFYIIPDSKVSEVDKMVSDFLHQFKVKK